MARQSLSQRLERARKQDALDKAKARLQRESTPEHISRLRADIAR